MLAAATLKAMLELSPFSRTSVPPDKTGLAPTETNPTLVPVEIEETLVLPDEDPEPPPALNAVISKFQVFDPVLVSVKAKVYPFEVPLVTSNCDEATPLSTEPNVVFKIELLVEEEAEIPKVVEPPAAVTASFPKLLVLAMIML